MAYPNLNCTPIGGAKTAVAQGYASPIPCIAHISTPSSSQQSGQLPFTGVDLGLFAIVAAGIAIGGYLLRRFGRTV